jgi:hypothetical protein
MLEAFLQFLHGEGDFVRTLQRKAGYVVTHKQGVIGAFCIMYHVCGLDKTGAKQANVVGKSPRNIAFKPISSRC